MIDNSTSHFTVDVSTLDIKAINPYVTYLPYCSLILNNRKEVVLWEGKSEENCQGRWEMQLPQTRQRKFTIPGIPLQFVVVNNILYYRPLGEK